ncbi:hypothetical protein [[Flexibacter] sp. ATCC 35208]|uniref:hypothetical protein n=1 Tax=[Flexibacter] sp. ATCC 35208 TaxID=1936242 RepID=UPI0009C69B49|nr:hypothetical protein [[Flexibacter] sp. ATCC 35208]OMP80112.1 hypothetical protein BW716_06360 [[Flexibacter] sp. ATCC 35208]
MYKLLYATITVAILSSCWPASKIVRLNKEKAPKLQNVLSEVQRQYKMALDTLEADKNIKLDITEADLTLKVTKEMSGTGEVKVLIFKPSGTLTNTRSTSVTYTLSQKENTSGGSTDTTKKEDFTLRDLIISSARELNSMNVKIGRLTEKTFSIDMSFSIEVDATGALLFDIGVFSIETGATKKHTAEHELKLSFKINEL